MSAKTEFGLLGPLWVRRDGRVIAIPPGKLQVLLADLVLRVGRSAGIHELATALWEGTEPRLAELRRQQAAEARIEADLQGDGHADLVADLRQLAAAEPLRERVHALLMTALYRDGQQGAALAAYRDVRTGLIAELGAEPGPGLQELHCRIRRRRCSRHRSRRRPGTTRPWPQITADLDRLELGQQGDGGWDFDWLDWSPGQSVEWRGILTLRALATLARHGRADLPGAG